jgi:hypothetical protein
MQFGLVNLQEQLLRSGHMNCTLLEDGALRFLIQTGIKFSRRDDSETWCIPPVHRYLVTGLLKFVILPHDHSSFSCTNELTPAECFHIYVQCVRK